MRKSVQRLLLIYFSQIGEQETGTVFDVVAFITYILKLQIHTYAILNSSVVFTDKTLGEQQVEYQVYEYDISRVRPAQVPKIATALNIILDHRGKSLKCTAVNPNQ